MKLELVTINILVPYISDEIVLECIAAGLAIMIDQHKKLQLPFDDPTMQEYARLTIGDHICELVGEKDDNLFSLVYDTTIDQIEVILAGMWVQLEEFATQVDNIHDIMKFWYPGLITLGVIENPINAESNRHLHLS